MATLFQRSVSHRFAVAPSDARFQAPLACAFLCEQTPPSNLRVIYPLIRYYTAGVASSVFSVVSTDFYSEPITVTIDIDDPATTREIIQFNKGNIIHTHRIDSECSSGSRIDERGFRWPS